MITILLWVIGIGMSAVCLTILYWAVEALVGLVAGWGLKDNGLRK